MVVSIHAPVKGATYVRFWWWRSPSCFNSRTRKGCDSTFSAITANVAVSIHAPVKGATFGLCLAVAQVFVSIHAPVKGATTLR